MLCINLHKQIDETKSNNVMYVFAQINGWNKIERCYVCVCTNQSMKQNMYAFAQTNRWNKIEQCYVCSKLMKQNKTMLCMHLHKQIDETK